MSSKPSRRSSGHGRSRPPRKTLQLCEQVRHTLEYLLTGELDDDILRMMYVASVEPAPDATRLLATIVPLTKDEHPDPSEVVQRLHEHSPRLRSAVAQAINRRKAPDLFYRYLETDPAAGQADAVTSSNAFDDEDDGYGEEE